KIWGNSSNNIYFVGRGGTIAHYDGRRWRRIESGTELDFQDIWGAWDEKKKGWQILAVASNKFFNQGNFLIQIDGQNALTVETDGLAWNLSSLWFIPGKQYFVAGGGFYFKETIFSPSPWEKYSGGVVTTYFTHRIRGTGLNHIVACGDFGELVHFNGVSWFNYTGQFLAHNSSQLGLAVTENLIVSCGQQGRDAVVVIGRLIKR
ncbi:MAG: glucosyl transferase, partial [Calditrichaeota bacterium]